MKFDNYNSDVINHYGRINQIIKCIEEMSELTQALTKYLGGETDNITEEIADVEIMLEQMRFIFDKDGIVDRTKSFKRLRQYERMGKV